MDFHCIKPVFDIRKKSKEIGPWVISCLLGCQDICNDHWFTFLSISVRLRIFTPRFRSRKILENMYWEWMLILGVMEDICWEYSHRLFTSRVMPENVIGQGPDNLHCIHYIVILTYVRIRIVPRWIFEHIGKYPALKLVEVVTWLWMTSSFFFVHLNFFIVSYNQNWRSNLEIKSGLIYSMFFRQ